MVKYKDLTTKERDEMPIVVRQIHECLNDKGWNIKFLSRKANIPYTTLCGNLKIKGAYNQLSSENTSKIAEALKVSTEFLYGNTTAKSRNKPGLQQFCAGTGLSEEALLNLMENKRRYKGKMNQEVFNYLLEKGWIFNFVDYICSELQDKAIIDSIARTEATYPAWLQDNIEYASWKINKRFNQLIPILIEEMAPYFKESSDKKALERIEQVAKIDKNIQKRLLNHEILEKELKKND